MVILRQERIFSYAGKGKFSECWLVVVYDLSGPALLLFKDNTAKKPIYERLHVPSLATQIRFGTTANAYESVPIVKNDPKIDVACLIAIQVERRVKKQVFPQVMWLCAESTKQMFALLKILACGLSIMEFPAPPPRPEADHSAALHHYRPRWLEPSNPWEAFWENPPDARLMTSLEIAKTVAKSVDALHVAAGPQQPVVVQPPPVPKSQSASALDAMVQPRRRSSSSSATSSRSASSRGSERRRSTRPVPIYELHYTADMARVPWVAQKTRKYERQESARASPVAVRQLERQQRRTIEQVEEEPRYVVRTPATPPPPPVVSTIPPAPPLPPPVQKQPPPLPPPVFAEPRHYDEPPSEEEEEEHVWHPPPHVHKPHVHHHVHKPHVHEPHVHHVHQHPAHHHHPAHHPHEHHTHPHVHHAHEHPQEHHAREEPLVHVHRHHPEVIHLEQRPREHVHAHPHHHHPHPQHVHPHRRAHSVDVDRRPTPSPSILKRQFTPRPVEREPSPPQTHRLVSGHDSSGYVTPTHLEAARPPSPPTEVELLRRMSELSLRPLRRSPSPKRQHSPVQLEEEVQQVEILIDEHEHRPHNEVGRRISDPEPFRRPRPRRRRSQQPPPTYFSRGVQTEHVGLSGVPLIENFEFARERRVDPHAFDAHPQLYRKLSHQSNHSVYLRHVDDHCVDYETISPFFRADSSCDECELSGRRASEPHANQGAGTRTYVVDLQQPLRL